MSELHKFINESIHALEFFDNREWEYEAIANWLASRILEKAREKQYSDTGSLTDQYVNPAVVSMKDLEAIVKELTE